MSKVVVRTKDKRVSQLLEQRKFQILKQNIRTDSGQIDQLARDGAALVIVEVKAKPIRTPESIIELIRPARRRQLILLADELRLKYRTDHVRIDLIVVGSGEEKARTRYYKGLIEYHG